MPRENRINFDPLFLRYATVGHTCSDELRSKVAQHYNGMKKNIIADAIVLMVKHDQ
jgi:hypothetical protein